MVEGTLPQRTDTVPDTVPDTDKGIVKGKNGQFIKPTIEEVKRYCEERDNGIDAQSFVDKYESNGWIIGKNRTPMKDWKATIRTWEYNKKNNNQEKKYL
jgi:hypothetical protein